MNTATLRQIVRTSCFVLPIALLSGSANADFVTFNGAGTIVHDEDVISVNRRSGRNFVVTFQDDIERECAVTATFEAQLSQNVNQALQRLQRIDGQRGQVVITVGRLQNSGDQRQLAVHASKNVRAQERVNVIVECDDSILDDNDDGGGFDDNDDDADD